MNGDARHDALKLTTYLGERDRVDGRLLADALLDRYARHGVRASCLLRGIEGFGARHALQTQRLLSLSEDLPLVAVALDARERIAPLVDELAALRPSGLITLERARLLDDGDGKTALADAVGDEEVKLTLFVGRGARAGGRPAHVAYVAALHDAGVAGATVLLGVEGTVDGARRRARVLGPNAQVPAMIVSVGTSVRIAMALARIRALAPRPPLATLEPVRVCKRDGVRIATPPALRETDAAGREQWQQLVVYASEQSRHDGATLHTTLVRRLRAEGAAGATALRGLWGYHGDHAPHGDRLWALRRRVPVVTVVVDRPRQIARWFALIDALTDETGLVTCATSARA